MTPGQAMQAQASLQRGERVVARDPDLGVVTIVPRPTDRDEPRAYGWLRQGMVKVPQYVPMGPAALHERLRRLGTDAVSPTAEDLATAAQTAVAAHRAASRMSATHRVTTRGRAIEACLEAALAPGGAPAWQAQAEALRREAEEETPWR